MSSENFWELFTETGDIGFYLLYKKSDGIKRLREKTHRDKAEYVQ